MGSLIGIVSATVCYLIYWPSPLSREPHTARIVYGSPDSRLATHYGGNHTSRYDYELAGMDSQHTEQSV